MVSNKFAVEHVSELRDEVTFIAKTLEEELSDFQAFAQASFALFSDKSVQDVALFLLSRRPCYGHSSVFSLLF